jgi:hypothetical protein
MFSVVYTPTEGDAIQNYSRLFRRPEGCYLNIHDQRRVLFDLAQWGKPEDIDYIVVSGQPGPFSSPSLFSSFTAQATHSVFVLDADMKVK